MCRVGVGDRCKYHSGKQPRQQQLNLSACIPRLQLFELVCSPVSRDEAEAVESIDEFLVLADFLLQCHPGRGGTLSYLVTLLTQALRFNQLIRVRRCFQLTRALLKLAQ